MRHPNCPLPEPPGGYKTPLTRGELLVFRRSVRAAMERDADDIVEAERNPRVSKACKDVLEKSFAHHKKVWYETQGELRAMDNKCEDAARRKEE